MGTTVWTTGVGDVSWTCVADPGGLPGIWTWQHGPPFHLA